MSKEEDPRPLQAIVAGPSGLGATDLPQPFGEEARAWTRRQVYGESSQDKKARELRELQEARALYKPSDYEIREQIARDKKREAWLTETIPCDGRVLATRLRAEIAKLEAACATLETLEGRPVMRSTRLSFDDAANVDAALDAVSSLARSVSRCEEVAERAAERERQKRAKEDAARAAEQAARVEAARQILNAVPPAELQKLVSEASKPSRAAKEGAH